MLPKSVRTFPGVTAGCAAFLVSLAACGSDSTGPSPNLDAAGALQSLSMVTSTDGTGGGISAPALLASFAPQLDQMNVRINGKSQTMFALALRETYPDGTCEETLVVDPLDLPPAGQCTPPPLNFGLILWQSHSADTPPDRLMVAVSETGLVNFEDLTGTDAPPGFALYTEGQDDVWVSVSGTLTSNVAATSQSCAVPLPPYAKSGSCSVATFDEQGTINFEPVTSSTMLTLEIPRQTINGIWQAITETQTVTLPST